MNEATRPPERPKRVNELTTLVLNADGSPMSVWPLSLIPVHKAVAKYINGRFDILESWNIPFSSQNMSIDAPKVVMCRYYAHTYGEPKFCRRSILLRDRFRCQYCGEQFPESELTYDHLVPRSRGGKTTWENILTACVECNAIKKDQDANFSGRKGYRAQDGRLRPLKLPYRPTTAELMRAGLEFLPSHIKEDFGSWLYWSEELHP